MECTYRWWLVDTGATSHITPYSRDLARSKTSNGLSFRVVGGTSVRSTRVGDLVVLLPSHTNATKSKDSPRFTAHIITRVFSIPNGESILSLPGLRRDGLDLDLQDHVLFSKSDPTVRVPVIYKHGRPYVRLAVTTDPTCYQRAFAARG